MDLSFYSVPSLVYHVWLKKRHLAAGFLLDERFVVESVQIWPAWLSEPGKHGEVPSVGNRRCEKTLNPKTLRP